MVWGTVQAVRDTATAHGRADKPVKIYMAGAPAGAIAKLLDARGEHVRTSGAHLLSSEDERTGIYIYIYIYMDPMMCAVTKRTPIKYMQQVMEVSSHKCWNNGDRMVSASCLKVSTEATGGPRIHINMAPCLSVTISMRRSHI